MKSSRKCKTLFGFVLIWLSVCLVLGQEPAPPPADVNVVILGNRVNVRSRPSSTAEVVYQADYGDVLRGGQKEGEWVRITPPDAVTFYTHSDFVKDGEIIATELNIRSGSSENFSVVGRLPRGTKLTIRETGNEWLGIAPPPGTSLWIHESLVRIEEARPPPPVTVKKEPVPPTKQTPPPVVIRPVAPQPVHRPLGVVPPPVARTPTRPISPPPPPPADLDLIPLDGQGRVILRAGMVRAYYFKGGSPSRFYLEITVNGNTETACYLKAPDDELTPWVGKSVRISGRDYWVQGRKQPVMVPEKFEELKQLP